MRKHEVSRTFFTLAHCFRPGCRSPPLLDFEFPNTKFRRKRGISLRKRYFRKKNPLCNVERIDWVEMSGKEYYSFVTAPENKGRYFIDMGNVVLECTRAEYKKYRAEDDHSNYILEQEAGWTTQSLEGIGGEELIADLTQDVEAEATRKFEVKALRDALARLDPRSYHLIYELYLSDTRRSERELAQARGVSQNAIHKQKKRILKNLKFLVVKIQKSSQ